MVWLGFGGFFFGLVCLFGVFAVVVGFLGFVCLFVCLLSGSLTEFEVVTEITSKLNTAEASHSTHAKTVEDFSLKLLSLGSGIFTI